MAEGERFKKHKKKINEKKNLMSLNKIKYNTY